MILENPSKLYKKKLEIGVGYYDISKQQNKNIYLNPKEVNEIILTQTSSISTDIFKLNPNINILIFNKGKLSHSLIPINNLPRILKNEMLFNSLSKHKRKKLMWIFCKAVCSNRIKVLSRLNETRKSLIVNEVLIEMRNLDKKLIKAKTREEIMGLEGNIAKDFYFGLSEFNDLFDINRNRNGKDIVNNLMNYAHTILRNKISYRLILNGLNPYHSFLHNNHRNQEYLTFDFAEFWIAYVDKLIFYSLEKGIIKEKDLTKEGMLNNNATKQIIKLINDRISNEEIDKKIKEFIGYLKGENRFSWKINS